MVENRLSKLIVNTCYEIHVELGPGLFESVYEQILFHELKAQGLAVTRQQAIPLVWDGKKIDHGFRADLVVANKVLIEIKSVEMVAPLHQKQVLTYLRLSGLKLGLLINFNVPLMKEGITRIVNKL